MIGSMIGSSSVFIASLLPEQRIMTKALKTAQLSDEYRNLLGFEMRYGKERKNNTDLGEKLDDCWRKAIAIDRKEDFFNLSAFYFFYLFFSQIIGFLLLATLLT